MFGILEMVGAVLVAGFSDPAWASGAQRALITNRMKRSIGIYTTFKIETRPSFFDSVKKLQTWQGSASKTSAHDDVPAAGSFRLAIAHVH
jgi:hypothetical protein